MRRIVLLVGILALLVPSTATADEVLLTVDNGDLFYDVDGDCVGDTDDADAEGAEALRHWHVGIPFADADAEVAGGWGCLGGPKTFGPVTVTEGAEVSGTIRYTWDTQVPGGCCNDVHLHIYDSYGELVASTLESNGPQPIVPMLLQVRTHEIDFTLPPGEYTFTEDVFSGEHSAWLTKLTVTGS